MLEVGGVVGAPEEQTGQLTLKEQMDLDIEDVFLNAFEFAELHRIKDKEMLCILEGESAETKSAHWEGGAKQSFDDGLYKKVTTLYVREKDYGAMPKVGSSIILDGKKAYTVTGCSKQSGMYAIELERTRQ